MDWKNWVIVILVALTGGWMLFDGTRALIVGDYVTAKSGEYAGDVLHPSGKHHQGRWRF